MAKLPPDWPELIADYVRAFHAQSQNSPKHHLEFVAKHHEHLLKQTPELPLTCHRPNGRTAPPLPLRASMRFYFHLVGPSGAISDDTGLEALSLEVAEVESRQAIQEILNEGMIAAEDWEGWQLEITDASQHVLLTIPLDQSQRGSRNREAMACCEKSHINGTQHASRCGVRNRLAEPVGNALTNATTRTPSTHSWYPTVKFQQPPTFIWSR